MAAMGSLRIAASVAIVASGAGCANAENTSFDVRPDSVDHAQILPVEVRAEGCGPSASVGSGGIVSDGLVLTAAHTVAGAETITVTLYRDVAPADADADDAVGHGPAPSPSAESAEARLVALDTVNDLAALRVDLSGFGPGFAAFSSGNAGDSGYFVAFGSGDGRSVDFVVKRSISVTTPDIYGNERSEREGLELSADAVHGDSGALLVGPDDVVLGMIFAISKTEPDDTYATDGNELATFLGDMPAAHASPCPGPEPQARSK